MPQCHGTPSLLCPVVDSSRDDAHDPRAGDEPVVDRPLDAGLDLVRRRRRRRRSCSRAPARSGVPGGDERQVRRRVLVAVGRVRLRAELVVGRVEVAREHARHQRAARHVDRAIDGRRAAYLADLDDAVAVDHDGGAVRRRADPVEQPGAGQRETCHRGPPVVYGAAVELTRKVSHATSARPVTRDGLTVRL